MDAQNTGKFIAQRRKVLGLTQAELAEKIHVTDKAISKWERGVGLPDIHTVEPLALALEVSVVELFQGKLTESDTIPIREAEQLVSEAIQISGNRKPVRFLGTTVLGIFGIISLFLLLLLISEGSTVVYSVGSLVTGLIAWAAPIWQITISLKGNPATAGSVSLGAALASLTIQLLQLAQEVDTADFAAIEDTIHAVCFIAVLFSAITLLLNVLMLNKKTRN